MNNLSSEEINSVSSAIENSEQTAPNPIEPPVETATTPQPRKDQSAPTISKAQFLQLEEQLEGAKVNDLNLERIKEISVNVQVHLGSAKKSIDEILRIKKGDVVELSKLAGEPVEIVVKDQLIARGEVVVYNEKLNIKIIGIAGTRKKLEEKERCTK